MSIYIATENESILNDAELDARSMPRFAFMIGTKEF